MKNVAQIPAGESSCLKYYEPSSVAIACISIDGPISAVFAQWRFSAEGLLGCTASMHDYYTASASIKLKSPHRN